MRLLAFTFVVLAACHHNKPLLPMAPIESPTRPPPPPPSTVEKSGAPLYTLDEVYADVTSGPLTYVGTGEWHGMFHMYSCLYKNARVFVINVYCTKAKEKAAFGMVVLSPTRGRAYLYAEGELPITQLRRADYITYRFEAEVNLVDDRLPTISLDYDYAHVAAWDEARYKRYPAGCYAGEELHHPDNGCMQDLEQYEHAWPDSHREILENPPDVYYQLVRDFRDRAKREGRDWTK
jgi:hypothetical protein